MTMIRILALFVATISGVCYFVLDAVYLALIGLFVATVITRFNFKTRNFGKFVEILFLFYLISYVIEGFGIKYPGSLIIVLTFLVTLIFFEGPEWSKLFFSVGQTKTYFKTALLFAAITLMVFGVAIYFDFSHIRNPVPVGAPFDALVIMGIGFAFYLPVMEEVIFRSFIYERATAATDDGGQSAIFVQGILYGLMAYTVGVPSGLIGLVLGGLFGIGLGYLVNKSGSIYLSIFVHFVVTLGTFLELAILGKF